MISRPEGPMRRSSTINPSAPAITIQTGRSGERNAWTDMPEALDQLSDEELACQVQAGATAPFEHLVSRYEGKLYQFLKLKTADPLMNKDDHKVALNLRGMFNDRADEIPDAEKFGHRISMSIRASMPTTLSVLPWAMRACTNPVWRPNSLALPITARKM